MPEPLTPERLAEIRKRARTAAMVTWTGGPDEKYWALNDREDLLAHIRHLTAERDAAVAEVARLRLQIEHPQAAQAAADGLCADLVPADANGHDLVCTRAPLHKPPHRNQSGDSWVVTSA